MKTLYNFVDAETGYFIGNLHELELAACPRAGEMVAFAADGQLGEVVYVVEHVKHIIHRAMDGTVSQIIDVSIKPVVAVN